MKEKHLKVALENIARDAVPETLDLMPNISTRLERKSITTTLRARPALVVLLVILGLILLTGVAYALGRSLGYIPGYGVINKNVQMQVLAEPVSQTRDGVTISIDEIILTSDKMYVTNTIKNIPNNLMLPMSDTTTVTCKGDWVYQLPDGSRLNFEIGSNSGSMESFDNGDLSKLSFHARGYSKFSTPINLAQITELTMHIPCVTSDIPAGSLPENWEFHLRFVPAPTDMIGMTAFPVIEYTPSPVPTIDVTTSEANPGAAGTPEVNPISIAKMIETGDSYILIGEFAPPPGSATGYNGVLTLLDGNGQQISWFPPMDIDPGTPTADTPFAQTWVAQFPKGFVPPLTIKFTEQDWAPVQVQYEFDAGNDPQPGNEWQVNQPLDVNGHAATLKTVRVIPPGDGAATGGYEFTFTYPDYSLGITSIDFAGYTSLPRLGFSGGGGGVESSTIEERFDIRFASLPKGPLSITFTFNVLEAEQTWKLSWSPPTR